MSIVENNYSEYLTQKYGPLLSRTDLANLLKRSPDALRQAERGDLKNLAQAAKVQIGRHVRFRAHEVARWIEAQGAQ